MTPDLLVQQEIKKFPIADAAISEMKEQYMPLVVNGVADKEGYKVVSDALRLVKSSRVAVDKKRKELNEVPLKWQRTVNDEAKRIIALIEPIESHLKSQKESVDNEKQRLKEEAERKEQEKIQSRVNLLHQIGFQFNGEVYALGGILIQPVQVKTIDDSAFEKFINDSKAEAEKINAEKEAEVERRRLEAEKLEQQKIEQKAKEEELARKEAELEVKKKKVEAERIAQEKAKEEAAKKEQQKRLAEQKQAEEAARLKEQERLEAERKAKIEALKPELEQLNNWVESLVFPSLPDLKSPQFEKFESKVRYHLNSMKQEFSDYLNTQYHG